MFEQVLKKKLEDKQKNGYYRDYPILQSKQGKKIILDGKTYLSFCNNDYLGLSTDPRLIAVFKSAANQFGIGSAASHALSGHHILHQKLEEELADFFGYSRCLVFSTGYMTNLGVISSLVSRDDEIYADRFNHASLVDAALLSNAKMYRYQHNNCRHLEQLLSQGGPKKNKWIISDGVFSVDGDYAPLAQLTILAKNFRTGLIIDDAHGFGVLGQNGRGLLEHLKLRPDNVPILIGTLSKALGCFGGFILSNQLIIEFLRQHARSYIYTTALPPVLAATAMCGLKILQTESWRREKLQQLMIRFRKGLKDLNLTFIPSDTPIQPILIAGAKEGTFLKDDLKKRGILVGCLRPPTVPRGMERLRITLSAVHTEQEIDFLLESLACLKHYIKKR